MSVTVIVHQGTRDWSARLTQMLPALQFLPASLPLPAYTHAVSLCVVEHPDDVSILQQSIGTPCVALVAPALLEDAVVREFICGQCDDYHSFPIDIARLGTTLGHLGGMACLRSAPTALPPADGLLGESVALADVRRYIAGFARSQAPVLITGESGTGKELVARAIHAASVRARAPLIAVNCGAFPEGLVQSELFGHRRGAFTGATSDQKGKIEAAAGGSLFLDEIGDLPRSLQVHLLRFLQEGTIEKLGHAHPIHVDVRVISATHIDLASAIVRGHFREDLHYRLNVLPLHIPPLRERGDDVLLLAEHYFEQFRHEGVSRLRGYSANARVAMLAHPWPGNVRELVNTVRRAIVMARGRQITAADLGLSDDVQTRHRFRLSSVRAEADRRAIEASLAVTGHNISAASRLLHISRLSLYRLMEKYHVDPPRRSG